jgi:pimeloyl-ACP methyl ester carboxylesterase
MSSTAQTRRVRPVVDGLKELAGARAMLPATTTAALADGPVEYVKAGDGGPAVVLLGGARMPIDAWALVLGQLARDGTVVAFNERGVGDSAAPRRPQTAAVVVGMLRELLSAAGVAAPYVLVGHGIGGLHANLFARRFPGDVAGVVLLESAHPDDKLEERRLRFLPKSLVRLSAGKHATRRHSAIYHLAETAAEIERAGPFPDVPLTVVSGSKQPPRWTTSPEQVRTHGARQRALVGLSALGTHAVAPASGHFPQVTDAEIVVNAVRGLVAASRR